MSERRYTRDTKTASRSEPQSQESKNPMKQVTAAFSQMGQRIDKMFPSYQTSDNVAQALIKYTPRVVIIGFVILLFGIIASRLNFLLSGALWGIPSLGAIGVGAIFWIWSSSVMMRKDLEPETRVALKQAMRFQMSTIVAGGLAMVYFIGLDLGFW